jgi:hypothetical protein
MKFMYFQTAAAIEGADATEEAIMVPASSLVAIEPADASTTRMIFSGGGIGDEDGATNLITVELDVTAANFQEFCRQISMFVNATGSAGRWTKDGMLVVASSESGNTKYFHSTVTACNNIKIKTAVA